MARSRIGWLLSRARAMTPPEVGLRTLRGVRNSVHRRTRGGGGISIPSPEDVIVESWRGETPVTDGDLWNAARRRILARGADRDEMLEALAAIGGSLTDIVAAADRILEGTIPAYGHTTFEIGASPDWNRDPESGALWPLSFWADVDFRFDDRLGDPRAVWEVNRHHHLVTLARAHFLKGRDVYAEAVWTHVKTWIEICPPYHGINWSSALEIGLRLISWGMALDIIGETGSEPSDARELAVSVSLQAEHLCDNLSVYASSRNNHLIGEAVGLLAAGAAFPYLTGAREWERKGRKHLEREILAQVSPDGVSREQTLHYQAFVIEFALVAMAAARALGTPLSPSLTERVGKMGAFLTCAGGESGVPPSIGDEDGGRAYDLADARDRQCARAAACAALAAGRPVPPSIRALDLEPVLWLFGPGAVLSWLGTKELGGQRDAGRVAPAAFPEGGYFIPTGAGQHGVIDCGPLGYQSIAAHGHADCLSIALAHDGAWVIVDPGTYCYHREPRWRNHFRGTAAHNTVVLDGADQSEMLGPFMWGRRARPEQLAWTSAPDFDYFEGAHDGYVTTHGVRHRRSVIFGRRGYWIVVDSLEGSGTHDIAATFQLATGFRAVGERQRDERSAGMRPDDRTFVDADGRGLWLAAWLPDGIGLDVVQGREEPPGGWISDGFGAKAPAPAIVASGRVELPVTLIFGLVPHSGERDVDLTCPVAPPDGGVMIVAEFPEGRDRCLVGRTSDRGGEEEFEGRLGFAAGREGAERAFGLNVIRWTRGNTRVQFESVGNLLTGDVSREEP